MKRLVQAALVVSLALPAAAFAAPHEIDSAHTAAHFTVRHMMVANVRGQMGPVTGTVNLDEKDLTKSKVDVKVDATRINTQNEKRDGHLKSPDFLDVAKHPALTFKSKKIEKVGDNKFKVTGDLTIRNVTKEVALDTELTPEVKDMQKRTVRGVIATTQINRKDFGLVWNMPVEGGGVLVGDDVKIEIDAELVKSDGKKS